MNKLSFLKGLFWAAGLILILFFFYFTNSKVNLVVDKNSKLEDSLQVLQKNLDELLLMINKINIDINKDTKQVLNDSIGILKDTNLDKNDKNQSIKITTFRLEMSSFCKEDKKTYKFILNPLGGVVKGAGVVFKNSEYYFEPSGKNVKEGKIKFIYSYKNTTAEYNVNVKECNPVELPKISLPKNEFCIQDSAKYKFNITPAGCKVNGPGVMREKDVYYFCPKRAKQNSVTVNCEFEGRKTVLIIKLKDCNKNTKK